MGTVPRPMLTANYTWPQKERRSERKLWQFLTQHPSSPQNNDSPQLMTLHCAPKTLSSGVTSSVDEIAFLLQHLLKQLAGLGIGNAELANGSLGELIDDAISALL